MDKKVRDLIEFLNTTRDTGTTYWYPLCTLKIDIPVVACNIDKIYKDNQICLLEQILQLCIISNVTMIQLNPGEVFENKNLIELLYARDKDGYDFPWCVEAYYYDTTKQWMIYVSHEGTITYAGEEMVKFAKEIIPEKYIL